MPDIKINTHGRREVFMLREDQALWVDFGVLWNRYDNNEEYMGYSSGHTNNKELKVKMVMNINKRGKGSPDWLLKILIPEELKVPYFEKGMIALIEYLEKNFIPSKKKIMPIVKKVLPDGTTKRNTESEEPGKFFPFKK